MTSCPDHFVRDIKRFLKFANYAAKGDWPVSGGTLDQSKSFLDAAEYLWAEEAEWRASLEEKHTHHARD